MEQLRAVIASSLPTKLKLTFKGKTVARLNTTDANERPPPKPTLAPRPQPVVPVEVPSVLVPDASVRYPPYQTASDLLMTLAERFGTFVAAHTQYLRIRAIAAAKAPETQSIPMQPVIFAFEGEFSVIADPAGGEVSERIHSVKQNVASALELEFTCTGYDMETMGTVKGRFVCSKDVVAPLSPPMLVDTKPLAEEVAPTADVNMDVDGADIIASTVVEENVDIKPDIVHIAQPSSDRSSTPTPAQPSPKPADPVGATMKRMSGELDVSVLWDRSHKYFPGMRTIIQFRLVG